MTTKAEAEGAIRQLIHQWANKNGIEAGSAEMPSFDDFRSWLGSQGYSDYLKFRSTMGPLEDAERWFDQELKQTWRN